MVRNPYGIPDAIYDYGMMSAPDRIALGNNPLPREPWKPVVSVPISSHSYGEEYINGYLGIRGVGEKEPSTLFRQTPEGIIPLNYGEKRKAFTDEATTSLDPIFPK